MNHNSVRRQELLSVKEQLEQAGSPILGTVLNMVPFDNYLGRKYYYKSYYYYDQHDGVREIIRQTENDARIHGYSRTFCVWRG